MNIEFLSPVSEQVVAHAQLQAPLALGGVIGYHTSQSGLPDLDGVTLAIIGIKENRKDTDAMMGMSGFDDIRMSLAGYFPGNWNSKIVDLGDIEPGDTVTDTYFLVQSTTQWLLEQKIVPLFIGGSQDLLKPIYRAYDDHGYMVNMSNVDPYFDIGDANADITSRSYIGKLITEQPYNLFNYSNLGYHTYLNSQEEIELIERLYFDALRVGELHGDISVAEPILRDSDIVGVDMRSVRAGDLVDSKVTLANSWHANPNGLDSNQICVLSRYAGISDRVTSFGIFEIPSDSVIASQLVAQMLWYFIEGYNYRAGEHPVDVTRGFIKYTVPLDEETLIFYKSAATARWWIEVPFIPNVNNKLKRHTLLPCNEAEYLQACEQQVPERWYKARRKNEV